MSLSNDFRAVETVVEKTNSLTPLVLQGVDPEWDEYREERWMRYVSDVWVRALASMVAVAPAVKQ